MMKLGTYLYIRPDDISAVSFSECEEGEFIEVWIAGNPYPFELWSQEAKEEIVRWVQAESR